MKVKRIFAIFLMLVSFFGTPMNLLAAVPANVTEAVSVTSGENVTVGNVTVDGSSYAVSVYASTDDSSVVVNGNVSLETTADSYALTVEGNGASTSASVTGNVTGESERSIYGVKAQGGASSEYTTTVTVTGDVIATASEVSHGVSSEDADITVGGKVTTTGVDAIGVSISAVKDSVVTVDDVEVDGIGADGASATGAQITTFAEGNASGHATLTVEKDIVATASAELYSTATGIELSNNGGEILVGVEGNVKAYSDHDSAYGIRSNAEMLPEEIDRLSNVFIAGDLISDEIGIFASEFDAKTKLSVYVGGTIDAKKAGVLINDSEYAYSNFELTAWKINKNTDGAIALKNVIVDDQKSQVRDENFEGNINYIIKTEKIEGAKILLLDVEGQPLGGTAKAGDTVNLKIDLQENYHILGAYNGKNDKVELNKDANGNYFVVVPNGGGVYLSLVVSYVAPIISTSSSVAGVRTGRATSGVLGVRVQEESKEKEVPEVEKIDDDGSAQATTLEDETLAGAQGADEGASMWLVWSLIALAAAAGFGVYKYVDTKKKAANTNKK